jgi:hypothetical protein
MWGQLASAASAASDHSESTHEARECSMPLYAISDEISSRIGLQGLADVAFDEGGHLLISRKTFEWCGINEQFPGLFASPHA